MHSTIGGFKDLQCHNLKLVCLVEGRPSDHCIIKRNAVVGMGCNRCVCYDVLANGC